MKTFLEFIAEAELIDIKNDQQELSKIRAEIQMLQRRDRPGDAEKVKELIQKASPLANKVKRSAQLAAAGNEVLKQIQDKPKEPENKNTITGGGYAQTGKSKHSRIDPDTLPGQKDIVDPRDDAEARSDTISGSRYVKPGSSGGRGTNIGRSGSTLGTKGGNR
jgi:hypothetical protein